MSTSQPLKVVIVGGGFGGLAVARHLGSADATITLVDRANHHLFQPLLYQVATATLSPADIAMPIRHILRKQRNTYVRLGEVTEVDWSAKQVVLADATRLDYDYLVIATGARHSYFGHPEWEAHAHGLKSIDDAVHIRAQVLGAFEKAEIEPNEAIQRQLMSFVVIGAGPTGVEMAGAIRELAHESLKRDFRHLNPDWARVILVEGGPRVLPAYDPKLSERAVRDLTSLGVSVRLDTVVKAIDPDGVDTSHGRIDARTIVWAAGVQASPVAKWLGVSGDKAGRVTVDRFLQVPDRPGVFVIGDAAHAEDEHGAMLPGLAAVATQQGKYLGERLSALLQGRASEKPFHYLNKGTMATIGRNRAIAQVAKLRLGGWFAWMAWLFVHIMLLVGFRNRLSVIFQWAWAYLTWNRGARLITRVELEKP